MLKIANENETHFLANTREAFRSIGFDVSFVEPTAGALKRSYRDDTYALFFRNRPTHDHALELRPAAFGPFWMIDKTADPAQKVVFKRKFHSGKIDADLAVGFFDRMVGRHATGQVSKGGYVLLAMQGVISRQRFWQSMSPIDMVRETIAHETQRKILIKLHPREQYSDADLKALNALADGERVKIVEGDLDPYLAACDYTVSMNSTVTIKGALYRKPGILFGDAEFHHIFQSVKSKGAGACFDDVLDDNPEFEKYLFWYLRRQNLWNYKKSIQSDILNRCRLMGWDI